MGLGECNLSPLKKTTVLLTVGVPWFTSIHRNRLRFIETRDFGALPTNTNDGNSRECLCAVFFFSAKGVITQVFTLKGSLFLEGKSPAISGKHRLMKYYKLARLIIKWPVFWGGSNNGNVGLTLFCGGSNKSNVGLFVRDHDLKVGRVIIGNKNWKPRVLLHSGVNNTYSWGIKQWKHRFFFRDFLFL